MGRRRVYGERADPRRNDAAARWIREAELQLASTDQAATEPETMLCECGEMMSSGVDHTCTPRPPRKRMPWEYTGSARAEP